MDVTGGSTMTTANLMVAKIKQERLTGNQRSLARLRAASPTRSFGKTHGAVVMDPTSFAKQHHTVTETSEHDAWGRPRHGSGPHWFASNNPKVGNTLFKKQPNVSSVVVRGELTRTAYMPPHGC